MNIIGKSECTAAQMAAYLIAKNPAAESFALEYAKLYLEEGETEGVRGDGAWIQSMKETGNFKFTGGTAVTFSQNNFCGLGVTSKGIKGASFETPRLGIRAQIQHLKAYASKEPLKNPCIDPRYKYVTKGIAPTFEQLAGRWAVPGYDTKKASSLQDAMDKKIGYGFDIINGIEAVKKLPKEGVKKMSTYSNSSLVNYTQISPNRTSPRNHTIDTITIHHMAGNLTVERCGQIFAPKARKGSSNYGIGTDGRIGLYVEEKDRAFTSSNRNNDMRAITIEVANDQIGGEWHVSDKALASLIELITDICRRNNIPKLVWSDNKSDRVNHKNGCNMTVHRDFAATACVPTYSEVLTRNGWKTIGEIAIGEEIACPDINDLSITFEKVYDKVPEKRQDTYEMNGLTATKDHRMVYYIQSNRTPRIEFFNKLLEQKDRQIYIPMAGKYSGKGLDISDDLLKLLIATQADGHYMYETDKEGQKHYYGLHFHFSKERKIDRLCEILDNLEYPYKKHYKSDGTCAITIYNYDGINIVMDICEKYLKDKCFTWDWIELSPSQARLFLDEIMLWDGCMAGKKYTSHREVNLDIVSAISALNKVGSRKVGNDVTFRDTPHITVVDAKRNNSSRPYSPAIRKTTVTCVSVKTGVFLMRQEGRTFIVGNCPGPYLMSKMSYIADEVNKKLGVPVTPPPPQSSPTPSSTYTKTQFIKDVQTAIGVVSDGVVGPKTRAALPVISIGKNNRHKAVTPLQKRLTAIGYNCGGVDGVFGNQSTGALIAFQKAYNLDPDGWCGPATWNKLFSI